MASKKVITLLVTLIIAGCSRLEPLNNYRSVPINAPTYYTLFKVKQHIYAGCLAAGWTPEISDENSIIARFINKQNQQSLSVDINFNQLIYDVLYRNSQQMEFTPDASYPQGLIHKNYNVWVRDLQKNIHQLLIEPGNAFLDTLPTELQNFKPDLALLNPVSTTASLLTCSDSPNKILTGQAHINRTKVNIRTGAGLNCTSIGTIYREQSFELLGQKGDWYQILLENNDTAWIYGSFVNKEPAQN